MSLSGGPLDYVFAFWGGVAISFTPCVFPLVPITAAYIGATSAKSRFKGFVLSLTYVSGIAVTYSILGLIASLTGQLFGRISSSGITYFIVGIVIIIFSLSMFDLFYIPLPNLARLPKAKKEGYLATFLLGATSGLIIGPCVSPALVAILAYLAAKKNVIYGMTLLFSFAYGMGLLLMLVGTFSGILLGLPKPAKWLAYVKRSGAAVLLASGIYFIIMGIKRL